MTNASTQIEIAYIRAWIANAAAMERLEKAVDEYFGPNARYELGFWLPYDEEFDDAVERTNGDTATVLMAEWKDAKEDRKSVV